MKKEKDDEKKPIESQYEEKDIDVEIKFVFDKIEKVFKLDCVGKTSTDEFYLRLKRFGSGTFNVEIDPYISKIGIANRLLKSIKLNNYE